MSTLDFPEIFQSLLKERGLSLDDGSDFLSPDYEKLHDPNLIPGMEKARDRIISAIKKKEHIAIYSDYDADGIPGAVVMHDLFRRIEYENVSFYIPHRHDEGFGLNISAIEEIREKGANLLVTIDCGVSDVKEVERANSLGLEVIVTDHHEPGEFLPPAFAIVNPKLKDSKYPFKELCGAGVAYKLIQSIFSKEDFGIKKGMEKWSLDMVGIATLSDMVPLVGENRILASFGLEVLRKSPRPGLQALFRKLNINQNVVTEDDVAFMITPRINAASRMGKPEDAFKLLVADNEAEALELATHLEKINNERKGVVASLVKTAKSQIEKRESLPDVIVIGNPEWKPSLLGLVANSLVEEYKRPAFVWGRDGDDKLKGSCRSYNGYNLHSLMTKTSSSFVEYGGHAGAGGFCVTLEQLQTLEEKLSLAIASLEGEEEKDSKTHKVNIDDVREGLWQVVSRFAPFGTGNPKPVFEIRGKVYELKQFGKEKNHMEVSIKDESGKRVKAISFFASPKDFGIEIVEGSSVALYANLEKSYFRNRPELRLRIVDVK